jgi:hypothetical protein
MLVLEEPCWGKRTLGCSSIDKPTNAPSHAMDTREKHHVYLGAYQKGMYLEKTK